MEAGGVPCIEAEIGLFEGKAPVKIFEKQNIGTKRGYAGLQKVQTDRIGRKYFPGERVSIVLEAVSGELFIFGGKKLFSRIDGSTRDVYKRQDSSTGANRATKGFSPLHS